MRTHPSPAHRGRLPFAHPLAFGAALLLALLLVTAVPWMAAPVRANTGCPSSTAGFGSQSLAGDCTVTSSTTWGNGTLTLAGNLVVNAGARLTLWNMVVRMNPSSDQQYRIYLAGGQLVVRGGTLTSANPSYGWRLETSTDSGVLLNVDRTNISYAGTGSYAGILLQGGNGHRLRHLTVTQSGLGSSNGVIDVNGGIGDLRVENSTFTNTGTAYYVQYAASGANLVFRDSTITSFLGSGPAVFGYNTQILSNVISVGGGTGIEVWGGGPGWPATNAYAVSGNTITTTGEAITTSGSRGYDVTWNRIFDGHVGMDGSGNRFAYNNVTGTDERVTPGEHVVWTSSNSSFDHNTFWNIGLTQDSVILTYLNYGNIRITDNNLYIGCYGNNCMGIETINVQSAQRSVYPGWPTVEIARNRITWTAIASGGVTIMLDNEFSEREWLHDNVEAVTDPSGVATSSLQGGGVQDSVYENNTILGPTTWCIYEYIYSDAGNTFLNNRCDRAKYAGIFQTGGNVYRDNVFTGLGKAGIWICPNTSCAGSNTNVMNNAWYNNTFTFVPGVNSYLTQMDMSNAMDNIFIGHGGTSWTDGSTGYPVYGDWLYFANAPITHLAFTNAPGVRTLTMTVNGQAYADQEPAPASADSASIAMDGSIDYHGSLDGGTVLSSLSSTGTSLLVTGSGTVGFTLAGLYANAQCSISAENLVTSVVTGLSVLTDASGSATFTLPFGATPTQFSITITASGGSAPPPPPPPALGASFTFSPTSPTATEAVAFAASATGGTPPYSYSWDFGDGSTGSGATVQHAYAAAGTYAVNLTVSDASSSSQYVVQNVGVAAASAPPPATTPPSVTTGSAAPVGSTSATLSGNLGGLGSATSVTVGFLYGTDPNLVGAMNTTVGAETSTAAFSAGVSGLLAGTTYYAAAWASGAGFTQGATVAFTTTTVAPTVASKAASGVSAATATLNGNLAGTGSSASVTVGFQYDTGASFASATNLTAGTLGAPGAFSLALSSLQSSTTYYVRAWASGRGFATGGTVSFTTLAQTTPTPAPVGPTVSTQGPSRIAASWATVQGTLTSLGAASTVSLGFLVGTSPSLSGATNLTAGALGSPQPFSLVVNGLSPKTTYYYAAWANGKTFALGSVVSFTTTASKRPPPHGLPLLYSSVPSVLSATYDPALQVLDLQFSRPMNRSSVEVALSLDPAFPYSVVWQDDLHLHLLLGILPSPGQVLELSIGSVAVDFQGQHMGSPFTASFHVPLPTAPLAWWMILGCLAILGTAVAVGLRRRARRRRAIRLARRAREVVRTRTSAYARPAPPRRSAPRRTSAGSRTR